MASFSDRLKALRLQKGLTQDDVAAAIGVSRSTIAGYEAPSKRREPDFEVVRKLADYFGVVVDYLLGRTDDPHGVLVEDQDRSRELDELLANEEFHLNGEPLTVAEKEALLSILRTFKEMRAQVRTTGSHKK